MKSFFNTILILHTIFVSSSAAQDFWERTNGPIGYDANVIAINDSLHIFAGTEGGGIFRSRDNGDSWEAINTGFGIPWVYCIGIKSTGLMFAGGWANEGPRLYYSKDNGQCWSPTTLPEEDISPYALAFNSEEHIYAAMAAGYLFRSTDDGQNWVKFDRHGGNLYALAFTSDNIGYTGGDAGVYRSENDGMTWTQTAFADTAVGTILVKPNGDVLVGTGTPQYGGGGPNDEMGVFLTMDDGQTWTRLNDGLTSGDARALTINGSGDIFLATCESMGPQGGVYRLSSCENRWTQLINGLNELCVHDVAVDARGIVFSGTDNRVFRTFQSTLSQTVTPILSNPPNGATNQPTPLTLDWNCTKGAISYRLQVSIKSNFSTIEIDQNGITSNSYIISTLQGSTKYYWHINAENTISNSGWSPIYSFTTSPVTSVQLPTNGMPAEFTLSQNYPNPFNPNTTIKYGLPREEKVTIKVYNVLGEEVVTLINNKLKRAGYHVVIWDRRNAKGRPLATGIHIYQIHAGSFSMAKKMLLVK